MSELPQDRVCQGCTKSFKTKQNYERHMDVCKELAIKNVVDFISREHEKELNKLRTELEETKSLLRQHGIIQESKSYKERVDYTFSKLPTFTRGNIIDNIKLIRYQSMLTLGENTVNTNFILYFVNAVKKFLFCTDISRRRIIIKREGNVCEKISAYAFILECFIMANAELTILLNNSIQYCMAQEQNLPYDDYTESMNQLILLRTYISQPGVNKLVKMIVNNLITNCDTLIRN